MKQLWRELQVLIIDYLKIIKSKWKTLIFLSILLGTYVIVFWFFVKDVPSCMFKQIFGIPCPGCGLTRSYVSLLKFDIGRAIYYNPLFWFYPIIAFVIIFRERPIVGKVYKSKIFWIISGVILITTYVIRMEFIYPNPPMDPYPLSLWSRIKRLL